MKNNANTNSNKEYKADSIKVLKKILNSNEPVDVNRAFKKEQQLTFQNKKNLLD